MRRGLITSCRCWFSAGYCGKLLAGLRAAYAAGRLRFPGGSREAAAADAYFEQLMSAAVRTDWVVYAKRPFGGPEVVLKYLARYTHRVAISNARVLEADDEFIRFRYKDYAHRNRKRVMRLSALEFVRRLLLHVLPPGFVRIRHYGLLSNRQRRQNLALCRQLLEGAAPQSEPGEPVNTPEPAAPITRPDHAGTARRPHDRD